ncbi:MAG: acetyl-CoA carboxylase biotin carboxylase subunit [bacterium]|nr:acetyl-CoA carboxylase biotin carboxylase subunit [bacterium]MDT8396512.1 acetyl-CoA carboxylase biotin carboxylase subunit [bacterium]
MFKKVLIANRGEIAVRLMRACRELQIPSVAIYSEADRNALHVRTADEAYCVGPPPSAESYLVMDRIIEVAKSTGVDGIHPGYGFLAENPVFAQMCEDNGITFIGPSPAAIKMMGHKTIARETMIKAGVPVVPGTELIDDDTELAARAMEIGLPVMVKAAAGGGGKGMRVVFKEKEIEEAIRAARSEATSAFGNGAVFVEKYVEDPRHIEFQVLADKHGNVVHLFERECSIQRRHQKVIEEAPSMVLDEELRERMGRAAVEAARAAGYWSAGTVEFLVDKHKNFFFLEMNTRLQVEHPVTEMITGIDIAKEMFRIASGEKLSITQEEVRMNGWALECRVYAEDPYNNFLPSPGRILALRVPSGPGVRDDSGVYAGYDVPMFYDPMISKLCTWGRDRTEAIDRMKRALVEYVVKGIKTTIPFHQKVMVNEHFISGDITTSFIGDKFVLEPGEDSEGLRDVAVIAAALQTAGRKRETVSSAGPAGPVADLWKMAGRRSRWLI